MNIDKLSHVERAIKELERQADRWRDCRDAANKDARYEEGYKYNFAHEAVRDAILTVKACFGITKKDTPFEPR
jgi:hypothetical protein